MADQHSSEDIERQLEQDRAGLTETLDDLKERFSIDGIIRQAADQFREHGGDIGASISRSVRDNPMALALTGVGLAWLIFGDNSGAAHRSARGYDRDTDPVRGQYLARTGNGKMSEGRNGGHAPGALTERSHDSRPGMTRGISGDADTPSWARKVDEAHGDRASNAAGSLRSGTQNAATATRDRATALWDRLAEGTERLSDEGRDRVIAARERVYDARDSAMATARKGQEHVYDMFEEQPLIAGALALAVGAAIGAGLPRTRFEDDHFGAQSDELIREAERILSEERAKVGAVVGAAMEEARDIARETRSSVEEAARQVKSKSDDHALGETAAQDMADKAKNSVEAAGKRVADKARAEADKQNLGKVQS